MIFAAFALLLLVALGAGIKSNQPKPAPPRTLSGRPADTRPLLGLLRTRQPSPHQLRAGAVYALGIGYAQAARVLRDRADFVENVRRVAALIDTEVAGEVKSPWEDVSDSAWLRYVRGSRLDPDARAGRDWLVGVFGLSPRLLERIGLMTAVRKDGDRWEGKWTGRVPGELFVKSLPAQVQALTAISHLHRAESGDILDAMIGREIDGQEATLSGLLTVALRAGGAKGLESWCTSPAERRKFQHTTAAFARQNGNF